ncbi:MAG TPA: CTP synthase [Candidatus Saccharibacteria bacterium]|nr:CTP synthase [Candidatus Saccharibacteria bacterium]
MTKPVKFVFVTGGVLSGLGKGITAASIGNILKARGLKVNAQKLDPYLNVDAGTLNPAEHGECFVTKDGAETDLDLGHYERFLDVEMTTKSSVMSGKIISKLIADERAGKFLGKTVQVVPHLTNAIQDAIIAASEGFDVQIVEIGGTVGDYESPAFFEAIRELGAKVGKQNCAYVHVVYMPYLSTSQEIKTKPAQNAVRDLRSLGIVPDVLVARSEVADISDPREKLSAFCGVAKEGIAILPNAKSVYEVPLTLEAQGIGAYITRQLGLPSKKPHLKEWEQMVSAVKQSPKHTKRIGVVAKYLDNQDTYMSVFEALKAAAWSQETKLDIVWVDAEAIEKAGNANSALKNLDGIVVPGGFGSRGVEGKIMAAQHALKSSLPYLGLCLGLQVGVIAAARNAGLAHANTAEIDPNGTELVIDTMADQKGKENTGGTMRLGDYPCILDKNSLAAQLYKSSKITERHRHRYECSNAYVDKYEAWGIVPVGKSPDGQLVEMIEGKDHPFFVASQFHPEFRSRPNRPHPMFSGFVTSLLAKK